MNIQNNYKNISQSFEKDINKRIKEEKCGTVFCVSVDNFYMAIGGYGEDVAESLLNGLMGDISKNFNEEDVIIRSDKSLFYVVSYGISEEEVFVNVFKLYELIRSYGVLKSPVPVQFKSTVGSAQFPKDGLKINDLMNKAYSAFNKALSLDKMHTQFSQYPTSSQQLKNDMVKATYIHNAFINNKLKMAYQPIVNGKTGDVEYYECLLRIIDENGQINSAGPFIPIIERMGFIDLVDRLVLNLVVKELKESKNLRLSVNLSNASMQNDEWIKLAEKLLSDKQVAERIIVEVTETSEQNDVNRAMEILKRLKILGCQIALDDFGTGYTSFAQLKYLPIDIIKIDGMFVRDLAINSQNKFFVETLVNFSHNFNFKTVAEFVENKEIADILLSMNIDFMQGNYFSPAVNDRVWLD